jgi:hypothetical protein
VLDLGITCVPLSGMESPSDVNCQIAQETDNQVSKTDGPQTWQIGPDLLGD